MMTKSRIIIPVGFVGHGVALATAVLLFLSCESSANPVDRALVYMHAAHLLEHESHHDHVSQAHALDTAFASSSFEEEPSEIISAVIEHLSDSNSESEKKPVVVHKDLEGEFRKVIGGLDSVIKYKIGGELGQGAWGKVYQLDVRKDDAHIASVAVKVVASTNFNELELDYARKYSGGHFPVFYGHYRYVHNGDGLTYDVLFMEMLSKLENSENQSDLANMEVAGYVSLLGAVKQMHDNGDVHRDIKLENVMLRRDSPVLVDFGIASRVTPGELDLHLYTKDYVPPEGLRADSGSLDNAELYFNHITPTTTEKENKIFMLQQVATDGSQKVEYQYDPRAWDVYQAGLLLWQAQKGGTDCYQSFLNSEQGLTLGNLGLNFNRYLRANLYPQGIIPYGSPVHCLIYRMLDPNPHVRPKIGAIYDDFRRLQVNDEAEIQTVCRVEAPIEVPIQVPIQEDSEEPQNEGGNPDE